MSIVDKYLNIWHTLHSINNNESANMTAETKATYYQVSYKFAAPNGQMRTGTLCLPAKDMADARKKADEALNDYDWYKIGTIRTA